MLHHQSVFFRAFRRFGRICIFRILPYTELKGKKMGILRSSDAMCLRRLAIRGLTTFAILAAPVLCLGQAVISTVAGTGVCCADADGVSATLAYLQGADGLTIDSAG